MIDDLSEEEVSEDNDEQDESYEPLEEHEKADDSEIDLLEIGNFGNCSCTVSNSVKSWIISAQKRKLKDMKLVIRDIEYFSEKIL